MLIKHAENKTKGIFYINEDGQTLAEMVYGKQPGIMVIQHTEVDESLRGKNIGFGLVQNGVEFAREQGLKIVPLCEFAKKIIEVHKELQDVL